MYYKLTNKESLFYKQLYEMRSRELGIEKENYTLIKQRYPKWNGHFLGWKGQQNFDRTTKYVGLGFDNVEDVDLKVFKPDKNNDGFYVPNKRTKAGKACSEFFNSLKRSSYFDFMDIVFGSDVCYNRFVFPFMEIGADDNLYFYLDDKMKLPEDFINYEYRV